MELEDMAYACGGREGFSGDWTFGAVELSRFVRAVRMYERIACRDACLGVADQCREVMEDPSLAVMCANKIEARK